MTSSTPPSPPSPQTPPTRPRFSVVVPALNEAASLPSTLASLRAQQLDDDHGIEIIVVDNGSSDATVEVARRAGVRVLSEPHPGVCAARQRGTDAARGEIVVSTDADTTHPVTWLQRIDARFRAEPGLVAVAGPCRYAEPPWWAAVFPPLWFAALGLWHRHTGRIGYLTATNVAFRRDGFPGYDTTLTQGGDEVDLLRRLRRWGPIGWDRDNVVETSSRRMDQGLAHTVLVSYGYYYALSDLLNRLFGRRVIGVAPTIRSDQRPAVHRRRRRWRAGLLGVTAGSVAIASLLARRGEDGPR